MKQGTLPKSMPLPRLRKINVEDGSGNGGDPASENSGSINLDPLTIYPLARESVSC